MLACSSCSSLALVRTSPAEYRYPLRATVATGMRVTTAFRRSVDSGELSQLTELRAATVAFAATLKAEGLPPEQVLIALKGALVREGWRLSLHQTRWPDDQPPPGEYGMYAQVFRWYLEGYFGRGEADDRGAPDFHSAPRTAMAG